MCVRFLHSQVVLLAIALAFVLPVACLAKRINPKPVNPVFANGVEYSADSDGRISYVVASDPNAGKELWRVQVFRIWIWPWLEEDVQWVFITDLKVVGDTLTVKDEKQRCYSVSLKTRRVQKQSCN